MKHVLPKRATLAACLRLVDIVTLERDVRHGVNAERRLDVVLAHIRLVSPERQSDRDTEIQELRANGYRATDRVMNREGEQVFASRAEQSTQVLTIWLRMPRLRHRCDIWRLVFIVIYFGRSLRERR